MTAITDNSGYVNETSVSIHMYYKLFEATTGDINGNTAKLYETKSIQPSFNIVPTDSILIAYFARTTSTNKTLTLYKGGTVNYSHIVTPIVYRHSSLKGLNEGEFQHLTTAQLSKINAISGTNTGDQDLSGKADVATTLSGYGITDVYSKTEADASLAAKQDNLVSGTNIKTINSQSLLGSGNIVISGEGGGGVQNVFIQETEPEITSDSLWIQRLPNGNYTIWLKGL